MAQRPIGEHPARGERPGAGVRGALRRRRAARRTVALLPTGCTLGNLLCGFACIFWASRDPQTQLPFHWSPLTLAAIFIFAGMVMDALDGQVARLTRNTSDLGEQLDSMADMVTFGVAPAFLAVQLVRVGAPFFGEGPGDVLFDRVTLVVACIYVACAALRLARFNIQIDLPTEADHSSFKGLPSPGAAGTVASLVLLHQHLLHRHALLPAADLLPSMRLPPDWQISYSALGMVAITLLVALAMVSRIRYAHFANRFLRKRAGISKAGYLVAALLALLIWPPGMFALAFTLYALSGPVAWVWGRGRAVPAAPVREPPPSGNGEA